MRGWFITLEGNEGSGKSTQIPLLANHLRSLGRVVRVLREPGGTPIGEEIRHTLKHSQNNDAMTAEAELLLMNASRAQLVREVIRPSLAKGEIVVCDRFYDSTTAYQGYGRRLNLEHVAKVIDFAVGDTRPDLTLLLLAPPEVSRERLLKRQATLPFMRDRMEEADQAFFDRVTQGYADIAAREPNRIRRVDATGSVESIHAAIRSAVEHLLETEGDRHKSSPGGR